MRLWLLVLLRLDERAAKARGLAKRPELELGAAICLIDLRFGDLRVRQEREARRDGPIRRHLHATGALARARSRPAGEPRAAGGSRVVRDRAAVTRRATRHGAEVDAGRGARVRGEGRPDPRGPRARRVGQQQAQTLARAAAVVADRAAVARRGTRHRAEADTGA